MEHLSIDDVVATMSDQMLLERMISEKEGVVVVDLFYNSGTWLPIVRQYAMSRAPEKAITKK